MDRVQGGCAMLGASRAGRSAPQHSRPLPGNPTLSLPVLTLLTLTLLAGHATAPDPRTASGPSRPELKVQFDAQTGITITVDNTQVATGLPCLWRGSPARSEGRLDVRSPLEAVFTGTSPFGNFTITYEHGQGTADPGHSLEMTLAFVPHNLSKPLQAFQFVPLASIGICPASGKPPPPEPWTWPGYGKARPDGRMLGYDLPGGRGLPGFGGGGGTGVGAVPNPGVYHGAWAGGSLFAVLPDSPPNAAFGWLVFGPYGWRPYLNVLANASDPDGLRRLRFALRTGPGNASSSTEAMPVVADAYTAFAARLPARVNWPDRRSIAMVMTCIHGLDSMNRTTNPNSYDVGQKTPFDMRTAAGRATFKTELLAFAAKIVQQRLLRGPYGAWQGVIVWDIEGEGDPWATYVGSPNLLGAVAPEMDAVADEFFATLQAGGLRVGVCVRPQRLTRNPHYNASDPRSFQWTQQNLLTPDNHTDVPATLELLGTKIDYARRRWNCTLFYVDSTISQAGVLDPAIFAELHHRFPDVLISPEESTYAHAAYAAPLCNSWRGCGLNYDGDLQLAFAKRDAFKINLMQNVPNTSTQVIRSYAAQVYRGDILLDLSWYFNERSTIVQQGYALAYNGSLGPVPPGCVGCPPPTTVPANDGAVLLAADHHVTVREHRRRPDTPPAIGIQGPTAVPMGRSAVVAITVTGAMGPVVLWPFVNGSQWGAQTTCEAPCSAAEVTLPLPYAGAASVVIAILQSNFTTAFSVGQPLPASTVARSSPLSVAVARRTIASPYPPSPNRTLVGMEWEPWFTEHNDKWALAEAVPLVGYYDSFNVDVMRQHAIWFIESGVDFLLVDWTNNLWNQKHFADRGVYAQELMNATTATLVAYEALRKEGIPAPPIVLLLGLDNGDSEPLSCLAEELAWTVDNYLAKFPARSFLSYEGRPLITIFDGKGQFTPSSSPFQDSNFTVRWMSAQLQSRPSVGEQQGYWSWMDGQVTPIAAQSKGVAEALTVTCAFFPPGGWLAPGAMGKRAGTTWIREMAAAAPIHPRFLVINQWNEYAGQPESPTQSGYADIYNSTLGNDMEPTSLTECAYPRPNNRRCGGWGFQYLNVQRATLDVYHGVAPARTVFGVARPLDGDRISTRFLTVEWWAMGVRPQRIVVTAADGRQLAAVNTTGSGSTFAVDLLPLNGTTTAITITCPDAWTNMALSARKVDVPSATQFHPNVTVTLAVHIPPLDAVSSRAVAWTNLSSPGPYEYGPTMVLSEADLHLHMFYCSPGDESAAWDAIRHTRSADGLSWETPTVALEPDGPGTYSKQSVCDPSVVRFRGTFFLFHTCINTDDAPDKYGNNRVCVALADSLDGPWTFYPKPVVQDLSCPSNVSIAYCVGQPSVVVVGPELFLYFSKLLPSDKTGPNPGRVFLAKSADGVTFAEAVGPIYSQRNVDVKFDRTRERFLLVQGDVGSGVLTWSTSQDGEAWDGYSANRSIETHGVAAIAGSNNNPGLVGLSDGSFSGNTAVLYGSSYKQGWGDWHLFRSDVAFGSGNCSLCAPSGCDVACTGALKGPATGVCARPGSTDPGQCCACSPRKPEPGCTACAPAGCVATCLSAKHTGGGICAHPGSTDPGACCTCFDAAGRAVQLSSPAT